MMAFMRKWHRYLGIWTALLVLMLSVTGILLVHKKEFGLNRIMVRLPGGTSPTAAEPWQIVTANDSSIVATKQGIYIQQGGKEWVRTLAVPVRMLKQIDGRLYAAARDGLYERDANGSQWYQHLASLDVRAVEQGENELLVATTTGIHVRAGSGSWKQLGHQFNKPLDVREITYHKGVIRLVAKEGLFRLENGTLKKEKLVVPAGVAEPMELQKLVGELHTGKLGGIWLTTAVDLTALTLIFLTVSGFWIWWIPRRRKQNNLI